MTDGTVESRSYKQCVPLGLATAGVLAWLWPIGLGGKMPVGGDVTQFSIGLMAELGRAIRAGRIPFWNDLWGYGFPGLAESQMGVYYPPHLLMYGLLPLELAYTLLLVYHTIWATFGGYWASRQFGSTRPGAAISGFAFATCGFFLVHIPHQWGASTASWMPWAWGLAWRVSRGEGGRRAGLLFAAVLAIQILPGHFQLAFITEVTTCLIGLVGIISKGVGPSRRRRILAFTLALIGVLPLALMQLAPTAELAALAKEQRTVDYLGAFSSPPTHLISYVAPGLFHQSPLWRPLIWDAFHAMPEEHLATIGLVPLFLAILALRKWREPAVIALIVACLAATIFSFGPYFPGFSTYCQWPGFSFFRAPARWGAGAMLALVLLAGRGFEEWGNLLKPGWSLRWFVIIAGGLLAVVIGLFELALVATEPVNGKPRMPEVAAVLEGMFKLLPWPDEPSLSTRMSDARQPSNDSRVPIALARLGVTNPTPADLTLAKSRGAIYPIEIGPTAAFLAALFILSFFTNRKQAMIVGLLALMGIEAEVWSRKRVFDVGPIQDLRVQSPLLAVLAKLPRGTRSIDPGKNLSMVAGVTPVGAYRTLDLPILPYVTSVAMKEGQGTTRDFASLQARYLIGVGAETYTHGQPTLVVKDLTFLGWLTNEAFVKAVASRFPEYGKITLDVSSLETTRAWFFASTLAEDMSDSPPPGSGMSPLFRLFVKTQQPYPGRVRLNTLTPEHLTAEFDAGEPGTLLNMSLYYPRWKATLNGRPVPVEKRFGCQAVMIPSAGHYSLELRYDATRDWVALAVSGVAWMGWVVLYWSARKRSATLGTEQER